MSKHIEHIASRIKEIKMTESEKAVVRHNIHFFIERNPIKTGKSSSYFPAQKISSPYFSTWNFAFAGKAVALLLIILIAGGGTLSYAASDAMPGDPLYSAKVGFNEEIQGALVRSPEGKVEFEKKLIESRIKEADMLVQNGSVNAKSQAALETALKRQITRLSDSLDRLPEDTRAEIAFKTTSSLAPYLESRQEAIKVRAIEKNKNADALIAAIGNEVRTVKSKESAVLARASVRRDQKIAALVRERVALAEANAQGLEDNKAPTSLASSKPSKAVSAPAEINELQTLLMQSKAKLDSGDYAESLRLAKEANVLAGELKIRALENKRSDAIKSQPNKTPPRNIVPKTIFNQIKENVSATPITTAPNYSSQLQIQSDIIIEQAVN